MDSVRVSTVPADDAGCSLKGSRARQLTRRLIKGATGCRCPALRVQKRLRNGRDILGALRLARKRNSILPIARPNARTKWSERSCNEQATGWGWHGLSYRHRSPGSRRWGRGYSGQGYRYWRYDESAVFHHSQDAAHLKWRRDARHTDNR